jgi:hypothetical protein
MQNSLGNRSENANFEFQQGAWNAEFTTEPQRECEFRVPARGSECRIHYGTTARMRILSSSKGLVMQNSLRNRSGNANSECQQGAWNAEFTTEPQRECEFRVPARGLECRIHYGTAARMRILSSSKGLEMQNSLRNRSGNANFECQQRA